MFIAASEYVAAGWLFLDLRPAKSLEVTFGRCPEVDAELLAKGGGLFVV